MRFIGLAARALRVLRVALVPLLAIASPCAAAAPIAGWDTHGLVSTFGTSPYAPSTTAANVTIGGLTRGGGVSTSGTAASRAWGGTDWTSASQAAAITAGDFVTFSVTPNAGFKVSFSGLSRFDYRRSGTGPDNGTLQYQIGNGPFVDVAAVSYTNSTSSGAAAGPINLAGIPALQNVPSGTTVTFRIVNYRVATGGSSTGTWYIFDVANTTADDLSIDGTVDVDTTPIDGACGPANGQTFGSAPVANLCLAGAPSAVTGTGPWNWTCSGTNGGQAASCSANKSNAAPFTIFHTNDVHARLTPHNWVIPNRGNQPDQFELVGGAAHLAGKMLSLVGGNPTALVLDGGDISEGNPVGDMNCTTPQGGGTPVCTNAGYGNGGMTAFYEILHGKLKQVTGRGGRGIDALVVGNHDVRDVSYIQNMEHMAGTGVPVISANVRDLNCTAAHPRYPSCEHFPPTATVSVNGTKVGIIGYTTSSATVGASLASTLTVVDCQWANAPTGCNISAYVNDLRNNQGADVVVLLTHDGHSDLVDPVTPVIADTPVAKVPEIAITGHWHTYADTVWQPESLNYKTIFAESSSYMKYIGELNVTGTGGYVGAQQHVLRNADITPDPDVLAFVNNLKTQFQATAGFAVDTVVGYTNDNLLLDNRMKWWSADEYPWNGNNTAGQWITDAMKWKCDQIWSASGGCDIAIEAGGGVRSDIPAGPMTYLHVYETFPWADDTYVRISMTGQDIVNFIKATNMDTGFSAALDVTAFDGIPTQVLMNGQPIGLATVYKVAINNYMLAHPPSGYTWPATINAEFDPANTLVRSSLVEFMQSQHATQATAYSVGGARYHFNGEFSGGYRAVVTMMNDNDSKPTFEEAYIRLLSATPETLARRGSRQVPSSLVNADGSIVSTNRLSEIQLFRSFLGFKTGALQPGDIIEVWGKASFFGGNPEFVDQEGVYANGVEFKVLGNDPSLAKPAFMSSIAAFMNDGYKNHYVKFLAKKTAADTVVDQNGQTLKIWDRTGFTAASLPGNVNDVLEISGIPTMESFALRFRAASAVASGSPLPPVSGISSRVDPLPASASAAITLTATAAVTGGGFALAPIADAQVASGNAATNSGASTSMFIESSTAAGTFGIERAWLKFDLSSLPAGSTITGATLQLWNWKSTGASLPVEVRGITDDSWTEAGITWNSQPNPSAGSVLDTKTLASGVTNTWYAWNVTSFVQNQFAGDKTVSLVAKPVDEAAAGSPSYGFDAKEFGSNAPVLNVTTQATASSVASLRYFYRFSADNVNWTAWSQSGGAVATPPYSVAFNFPNGVGYYEFYSVATDNLGGVEPSPTSAQSSVRFQTSSSNGQAQTISFAQPAAVTVGGAVVLSASATSGLEVTFSSQSPSVCTVSNGQVATLSWGTCSIDANQAGDLGYWQAAPTANRSFAVQALGQSISFGPLGGLQIGGSEALGASASSGLGVVFSSVTPAVCSVSGNNQVVADAAGLCTIAADQPGNAIYGPAQSVMQSFSVTSSSSGGGGGTRTVVPVPAWALGLLAIGLLYAARRRAMVPAKSGGKAQ